MSNVRSESFSSITSRKPHQFSLPSNKISDYFATNVFHKTIMKEYLSKEAYESVMIAIDNGQKIDREIADQVASSLKSWAMSKGATHYTHWFQPLTGTTAEKHDSFFTPTGNGKGIENFGGDSLVQQEPDASSFPNGGIRNTFEARGYTAWDPSSPAFIMEIGNGKTLFIPTIFVAYTGEALDYKAPLLKSLHLVNNAATKVCQYFDKNVKKVTPTLGWEQEYFIIDAGLFQLRPDLVLSGRTLFGHSSAKDQQLDDHYFGSIPERAYSFMLDLEAEALKLGIPLSTRHNEVAPTQYEFAPMFEDINNAVDHNQLLMDLMDRIAKRHQLRILLHEKPYEGINGSGKHNNWSLGTDTGKNLLSPGKTPKTNLQFLTFFINVIKAVHTHAGLLRATIASAGNDFRLGANEAPPAIISIFIGSHLTHVLDKIEKSIDDDNFDEQDEAILKLDIHNSIPDLLLDNTDRNRTSPFAFTGNKFEIRAAGSSANCSPTMTAMNTMVADQLIQFKQEVDKSIKSGVKKDSAILKVLKRYIKESKAVLFEGDGYSQAWQDEAKKRGLPNLKTSPEALEMYITKESRELFGKHNVLSDVELDARHEILLEKYIKTVQIEARIMGEIALSQIVPAVTKYQNILFENINGQAAIGIKGGNKAQKELLDKISLHLNKVLTEVDAMTEARKKANGISDISKQATAYCQKVKPFFDKIRYHADKLELYVDDKLWPLPKYRELLFAR